jgi:HAD superfamily hydrolase (TIGR01484 family)
MWSLDAMPAGVRREVRGVIFDVDDTLTTRGSLESEAFDALWSLRRAGVALVALTGRPLGWTDAMASMWPIDAAVGENGAGWAYARGGTIETGYFSSDMERAAQARVLERVAAAVSKDHPRVRLAGDQGARRCDLAFDVGERAKLDAEEIAALVHTIETVGARALVSSVHAHVIAGQWDKARGAVRAIREAMSIELDRARWVFVGDSGNDAPAFSFFELTVGVANVREHLHRLAVPPRYVTHAERGAGFAELARAIAGAK